MNARDQIEPTFRVPAVCSASAQYQSSCRYRCHERSCWSVELRLNHVTLMVSDVEASVDFYARLGLTHRHQLPELRTAHRARGRYNSLIVPDRTITPQTAWGVSLHDEAVIAALVSCRRRGVSSHDDPDLKRSDQGSLVLYMCRERYTGCLHRGGG